MGDSNPGRLFICDMLRVMLRRKLILVPLILISGCASFATPTLFIPPTAPAQLIEPTLIIQPTQQIVAAQPTPLATVIIPTTTTNPTNCINNLTFVSDLTIPDGTYFTYGAIIDKQWVVENSGTCNWNSNYHLRYAGGAQLGAPDEIFLYPAKSGTQATIQIKFTAPFSDGDYASAWQAFDPNGLAFGDVFYLRIVVGAQ